MRDKVGKKIPLHPLPCFRVPNKALVAKEKPIPDLYFGYFLELQQKEMKGVICRGLYEELFFFLDPSLK